MANKPSSAKGERFAPYLKRKMHLSDKLEQKSETLGRDLGNTFDESIAVPTVAQSGYEEQVCISCPFKKRTPVKL